MAISAKRTSSLELFSVSPSERSRSAADAIACVGRNGVKGFELSSLNYHLE